MKKNIFYLCIGIFAGIFLTFIIQRVYYLYGFQNPDPYMPEHLCNVYFAKQNIDNIEVIQFDDPTKLDKIFYLFEDARADYAIIDDWRYQVIFTSDIVPSDADTLKILNSTDEEEIIRVLVYEECVEINGITYVTPYGQQEFYEWTVGKWNWLSEDYKITTLDK